MSWLPKALLLAFELLSEVRRERAAQKASRKTKEAAEAKAKENQRAQEAAALSHKVVPIKQSPSTR